MDKQCQDRCHRIGQTRDVHIYRFVSEFTIEENIFKKANQKRMLDNVVITEGNFTSDFFNKVDWRDMLGDDMALPDDSGRIRLVMLAMVQKSSKHLLRLKMQKMPLLRNERRKRWKLMQLSLQKFLLPVPLQLQPLLLV